MMTLSHLRNYFTLVISYASFGIIQIIFLYFMNYYIYILEKLSLKLCLHITKSNKQSNFPLNIVTKTE